jgi:hypothetical protein
MTTVTQTAPRTISIPTIRPAVVVAALGVAAVAVGVVVAPALTLPSIVLGVPVGVLVYLGRDATGPGDLEMTRIMQSLPRNYR